MKRLLAFLIRLFFAFAWLLVAAAAILIAAEESGFLTRIVRERMTRELGALGAHVHLERARLLWFEPGLVLDGLTFDGQRDEEGRWTHGTESLRLSSIHVRFDPRFDPRQPVREIEVRGGRLSLSQGLVDAAQELARARGDEPGGTVPPISVTGIALELRTPAEGATDARPERVPLGSADLRIRASDEGGAHIRGRLNPSLAGAVVGPATIVVDGAASADGTLAFTTSARGLALDSSGLATGDPERLFGLSRFRGELDLDVTAHVPAAGPPVVQLMARLTDTSVELEGELPLEGLSAACDIAFAPRPGMAPLDPDSWSARVEAEGSFGRSHVQLTAVAGADATPGSYVEAWARVRDLHLDWDTLRAVHLDETFDVVETFHALEPEGVVDVAIAARLPRASLDAGGTVVPEIAATVELDGRTATTFRGWFDDSGVRRGVPLRCDDVRGRVVYAMRPSLRRPARVALVDMSADHGAGRVHGEGLFFAPIEGDKSNLDLELRVPSMPLDPRLGEALRPLDGVARTWDALNPNAGTASATWQLRRRPELRGVTGVGAVEIHGASFLWEEVPVPLTDLHAKIDIRWAGASSVIVDEPATIYGDRPTHRPIGILWSVETVPGSAQSTGLGVSAHGILRESPLAPEVERAAIPEIAAESLSVQLSDLLLRGRDWDVLAARFPDLGEQVAELRGQGRVDISFRGRRPTAAADYRYDVEATARPGEVVVTPSVFRRQTQDVAGRVLLRGRETAPDVTESDGRFHVFGAWGGDVVLASMGTFASGGGGDVIVRGAGVDPKSPTLRGALSSSLAGDGEQEVDLASIEIDGRLDFEAAVHLPPDPDGIDPEPTATYRIFLRDNRFRSETFGLDALAGVLTQEGGALSSPLLRASLADTPLFLTDVLLLPLATAADHPRADERLGQAGFQGAAEGFAFQADWSASNILLDREHLTPFVDEATLDTLLDRTRIGGAIDVDNARVLAVTHADGGGKVAFRGAVTPRRVAMKAGMPLFLESGAIDVRDLVLEAGRLRGWWRIDGLDAEVAGREVADAAMTMTYVDGRLTIDNLRGAFAGGEITSLGGGEHSDRAIAVDLTEPYAYTVAVRLRDVAVQEVLGGLFSAGVDDLGALSSTLRVKGRGASVLDLAGNGSIRLADARLWSIPVVRELFRSLGADATAVFDRMELAWTLEDGTLSLQDMRVRSPLLRLVGDGTVELTGEVSADLQVRYSLVDKLGPLNRLVYWLNNSLWRVAVRGDMGRPVVLVRNSFLELLTGFDDDVPRSLPLPGWDPLPARF